MKVLYINKEHCTSLAQLKGFFTEDLTPESDIYADLLDCGRHGDMAKWLSEQGEPEFSSKVASISSGLSDSAFYAQLKSVITGVTDSDATSLKPAFDKCFSFEDIKCDVKDSEAKVHVSLKVLMCVNEEYELRVSSDWGMRAMTVNPYRHPEGKSLSFEFTCYKCPGKDIGEITVLADGKELSRSAKFSRGGDEIFKNAQECSKCEEDRCVFKKIEGITLMKIKMKSWKRRQNLIRNFLPMK